MRRAVLADERRNGVPELASQFVDTVSNFGPPLDANGCPPTVGLWMPTARPPCRLPKNVTVQHPADLVAAVPARVFRRPVPRLLVGDLDLDAPARGDVEYLSLPHSRAARGVRVVAEGDDLPRLEPEGVSLLHFCTVGLHALAMAIGQGVLLVGRLITVPHQ
jgi:hypothetical protein